MQVTPLEVPNDINYFHFKDGTEFTKRATFGNEGSYLDPFRDVLAVFNSVDEQSKLTLTFSMNYNQSEGTWEKLIKMVSGWLSFFFFRNKENKEKKNDSDKPVTDQTTIYMKIGYSITSADPTLKDVIK